jgi:hypothetical protein
VGDVQRGALVDDAFEDGLGEDLHLLARVNPSGCTVAALP